MSYEEKKETPPELSQRVGILSRRITLLFHISEGTATDARAIYLKIISKAQPLKQRFHPNAGN
jgi:hypothetical protein